MYNYSRFLYWRLGRSGKSYSEWTADRGLHLIFPYYKYDVHNFDFTRLMWM